MFSRNGEEKAILPLVSPQQAAATMPSSKAQQNAPLSLCPKAPCKLAPSRRKKSSNGFHDIRICPTHQVRLGLTCQTNCKSFEPHPLGPTPLSHLQTPRLHSPYTTLPTPSTEPYPSTRRPCPRACPTTCRLLRQQRARRLGLGGSACSGGEESGRRAGTTSLSTRLRGKICRR